MKNKKYKVRANGNWKKYNLKCTDFKPKRIPNVNEEWSVDELRLKVLLGANPHKVAFVEMVKDIKVNITSKVEQTKDDVILTTFADGKKTDEISLKETPVKKTTTKKNK